MIGSVGSSAASSVSVSQFEGLAAGRACVCAVADRPSAVAAIAVAAPVRTVFRNSRRGIRFLFFMGAVLARHFVGFRIYFFSPACQLRTTVADGCWLTVGAATSTR